MQDEPRVCTALADPAVGNNLAVGRDALALVKAAQLLPRQERACLGVDCLGPRDVSGTRDVPWALRLLLRQVRRSQQLASVLLGRAHVHEAELPVTNDLLFDELAPGANVVREACDPVSGGRLELNGGSR